MTLVHIGIFGAGVLVGWMLAKNKTKSFSNLTAGDLKSDWEYCTKKCYTLSNGGYACLQDCMKKRGNPIN